MAAGTPPALAATLRAQHDVVSREQALAAGMTVSALWHRVQPGGAWRAMADPAPAAPAPVPAPRPPPPPAAPIR